MQSISTYFVTLIRKRTKLFPKLGFKTNSIDH